MEPPVVDPVQQRRSASRTRSGWDSAWVAQVAPEARTWTRTTAVAASSQPPCLAHFNQCHPRSRPRTEAASRGRRDTAQAWGLLPRTSRPMLDRTSPRRTARHQRQQQGGQEGVATTTMPSHQPASEGDDYPTVVADSGRAACSAPVQRERAAREAAAAGAVVAATVVQGLPWVGETPCKPCCTSRAHGSKEPTRGRRGAALAGWETIRHSNRHPTPNKLHKGGCASGSGDTASRGPDRGVGSAPSVGTERVRATGKAALHISGRNSTRVAGLCRCSCFGQETGPWTGRTLLPLPSLATLFGRKTSNSFKVKG